MKPESLSQLTDQELEIKCNPDRIEFWNSILRSDKQRIGIVFHSTYYFCIYRFEEFKE